MKGTQVMSARTRERIDPRLLVWCTRHRLLQLDPLGIDEEAVPEALQHVIDQPGPAIEEAYGQDQLNCLSDG